MLDTPRLDPFSSILFADGGAPADDLAEPPCFRDLNLDQVVASYVGGRGDYALEPSFYALPTTVEDVEARQDVFRDLERSEVQTVVRAFSEGIRRVGRYRALAEKQRYADEKRRWHLDAASAYCAVVTSFANALAELEFGSARLRALARYVSDHVAGEPFRTLAAEARTVEEGLANVRYTVRIKGLRVTVARYDGEPDYSAAVEATFERFSQGAVDEHRVEVRDSGSMDHVEAQIADRVARLFEPEFRALAAFCAHHATFTDVLLLRFEREVQFYLACLEHRDRLAEAGVAFCYPRLSRNAKTESVEGAVDLALAAKTAVVPNDYALHGPERILVVTGPNQGGKTTFARMLGQLHWLAALGLPVAARRAELFLCDAVFTHFEREEDIATLRGKLDDELFRVRGILDRATADSVVVLNEIFASTTLADALELGARILERVGELGCLAVCVTFVDELAALGPATVSMVAGVEPHDPSMRTFEIVRRNADGRAYAWALADKYGLSYERLRERLR